MQEIADAILKQNAYINTQTRGGETPLFIACEHGHVDMVRRLLENTPTPADINLTARDSWTPLLVACKNGYEKVVALLISKGKG